VISSLRLGDDQDRYFSISKYFVTLRFYVMADRLCIYVFISSSLFANSNWFTFDGGGGIDDHLSASISSSSPSYMETSLKVKEADDGKVIGTEDEMETIYLGNGSVEEVKDVAECNEQPNCCTEDEQLKNTGVMERHRDASNHYIDICTNEVVPTATESSAPSIEIVVEKIVDELAESSLDSSISIPLPTLVSTPANLEASSEQVAHDTDVQQPVKEAPDEEIDAKKTDAAKVSE
jgi:serine/threonine-protein phosphatase 6 regulatory subunit 3